MQKNRAIYLQKVLAVQVEFSKHWDTGLFTKRKIWQLFIQPKFYVCETTMYRYNAINARKMLREMGLLNNCVHNFEKKTYGMVCTKCHKYEPFNK